MFFFVAILFIMFLFRLEYKKFCKDKDQYLKDKKEFDRLFQKNTKTPEEKTTMRRYIATYWPNESAQFNPD